MERKRSKKILKHHSKQKDRWTGRQERQRDSCSIKLGETERNRKAETHAEKDIDLGNEKDIPYVDTTRHAYIP